MNRFSIQLVFALLSALFIKLLWPPFNQPSGVWFALVPLLLVIRNVAPRRAVLLGFITGWVSWIAQLWWMTALTDNAGPWALVYPALFALSAVLALFYALFAGLASAFRRYAPAEGAPAIVATAVVEPILFAATETLRSHIFTGFAWNPLGLACVAPGALPVAQLAAVGGASLVTALVVAVNGGVATFLTRIWRAVTHRLPRTQCGRWLLMAESLVPFALLLCAFLWGMNRIQAYQQLSVDRVATFVVERTDVPSVFTGERVAPVWEHDTADIVNFFNADAWIWPESSLWGYPMPLNGASIVQLKRFSAAANAPLLLGGTYVADRRFYNAAMLFTAEGLDTKQVYAKRHLVPFGEYIPFDKTFPWLQNFAPTGMSCTPGEAVTTLTLPSGVVIGPLICFEDTVESVARASVRDGARVLVNMSNDAWYSPSPETAQHAQQAQMRCIETGVPMVRSTNRGDNTHIDAVGRVAPIVSLPTRVNLTAEPFASAYLLWGEWCFGAPAVTLLLLFLAYLLFTKGRAL